MSRHESMTNRIQKYKKISILAINSDVDQETFRKVTNHKKTHIDSTDIFIFNWDIESVVAQWLSTYLPLVLKVPGLILASGEENVDFRTRFP